VWICVLQFAVLVCSDLTPVGANLDGIADYSRTVPFVDLVRQSRKFGSPSTPWDGNCAVDSLGWPTTDFGVILTDGLLHFGGSTFQLRGVFAVKPNIVPTACSPSIQNVVWDASTKVLTATVVSSTNDDQLMLGFTDTSGGCRDLSVRITGYADTDVFTSQWLSMLSKFQVLRFMDWGSTNGNPVANWADRTPPTHPSWAYGPIGNSGAPWEVIIQLVNTLKKDIWINVPHQATDDYVTNLAQLFKQNLDPTLNLYIEYSNEVWNWQFEQATWNLNFAIDEVTNKGDPNHLNYDLCGNKW
jgi:hypothetical protein